MLARKFGKWFVLLAMLAAVGRPALADDAAQPPGVMLYLTGGDHFAGSLEDSDVPDVIRWRNGSFANPFEFSVGAVRAAYFPAAEKNVAADADYCFEFSNGDMLFGSLVGLTPEKVEIDSQRFGRLHVDRGQIRQLQPWRGAAGWQYSGPNGLSEWDYEAKRDDWQEDAMHFLRHGKWKDGPQEQVWHEEAGYLLTEKSGARIRKEIKVPASAQIEFALSWSDKPRFIFGIAAESEKEGEKDGFHFEVWNNKLVVVGELSGDADVAPVYNLADVKNRIHLQVLMDRKKGQLSVHSLDGAKLAELSLRPNEDRPLEWITLRNQRGDVRFEQLVVSQWNGQLPPQVDVDRQRILLTNGDILYGEVTGFEPDAKQFTVRVDSDEKQVAAAKISSIVFEPATPVADASLRVTCHDGTRVGGKLAKVEANQVHITRPGIEETLIFSVADVRSLIGTATEVDPQPGQRSTGRLELEGVCSHGALVDGTSNENTSCLVWEPNQSKTASPLQPNASGRIVYRDPPPSAPEKKPAEPQPVRRGFFQAIAEAFTGPAPDLPSRPRIGGYPHTLFLLAGDRIPCVVNGIDEEGVHFTSSVIESEVIPHEQIKALELAPRSAARALAEEKRLRLLTLPRIQRNNPPTHLIGSLGGDFLRVRLQSMNGQVLAVETRLETKHLPRGQVASIIWLHPASDEKKPVDAAAQTASSAHVQTVRADGVRLTFVPREFKENSLVGASELLGACQVDMKMVDQLLFGKAIGSIDDASAYDSWALYDAIEPKFTQDSAGEGTPSTGLNSALVSNPAPDFKLELLSGGEFRLSEQKGQVVVLDFWASWCAECMRGMPEMIQVSEEFADQGVKYVAVNLQEDRASVASTMERMKLAPDVVLDIDGATSEKYEVTAIPQVVIVDQQGKVARLFIGGDSNFGETLRQSLQELVEPNPPAKDDVKGP